MQRVLNVDLPAGRMTTRRRARACACEVADLRMRMRIRRWERGAQARE